MSKVKISCAYCGKTKEIYRSYKKPVNYCNTVCYMKTKRHTNHFKKFFPNNNKYN